MKITILDDYQHIIKNLKCFDLLKNQNVELLHQTVKDSKKLAEILVDTNILVLTRERTAITTELLNQLPKLQLISQTGKISNHLNLSDCTKHRVAVAEGIGSPTAPAELTWNLIMNSIRKVPQAIEGMKKGEWQINIGKTIAGKTIGIWGYGKIGKKIAQYAKVFDAEVLVWGSETSRNSAINDGFKAANSKDEFFSTADVISIHVRLNDNTRGIVTEQDLMLMKSGTSFINTARAELVEQDALINVLKTGKDIQVAIDVYETEPIYEKDYALLQFSNVICTPHIGYVEMDSYELYFSKAFENVIHYIEGNPTNIANPEVL